MGGGPLINQMRMLKAITLSGYAGTYQLVLHSANCQPSMPEGGIPAHSRRQPGPSVSPPSHRTTDLSSGEEEEEEEEEEGRP